MSVPYITVFTILLRLSTSYNIGWSAAYTYYDGGTVNPNVITLRGSDPEHALICFEEVADAESSGVCETLRLDISGNTISPGSKSLFADTNASIPYQIQIYNNGPTNNFLLGYTHGPYRSSGRGEVLIGSFQQDDASLQYGAPTTFNPGLNDETRLIELQSDGYFIICSAVGPNNQYNTGCRIASYDVDTLAINIGNRSFDMTRDHQTHAMTVSRIASDGFIACFAEYVQRFGACYVGSVVYNQGDEMNSLIIFSDEHVFYNTYNYPIDDIRIVHVNQTVLAICYNAHVTIGEGGKGECKLAVQQQIGGIWTMLFYSRPFEFSDHEVQSLELFRVNANSLSPGQNNPELIVLCYVDGTNGFCKFGVVDLDTISIEFETATTNNFHPSGQTVGSITATYLGYGRDSNEANYLVLCYTQFSGSTPLFNRGFCKLGTITD